VGSQKKESGHRDYIVKALRNVLSDGERWNIKIETIVKNKHKAIRNSE
jgi:hypothetical protein